ncbi:amino acid/amide ABC transporter substrate-binding protein, HAAT family [Micromonospora pattaloongensis]|uniref:Amino acid/amide ABC transporter substrate-binding protein, HAAT family n=1 Tax=Micromonospora pattaloongensis TaxID=405436 RepID=A0A1H3HQ84_9ACTN|nr:ABC transporter substrate-binding protein [Micromonospora pattaloongensis]SDY17637.1 amino acid/amide ABC transporter substrate-binding protein, HAAT family [Micromonospora pattaloongensis]
MSQMDRRQALKLLAALGATGLVAACTDGDSDSDAGEPVRIGLIAPQTGGYKPIGQELVNGFQLFLDLNNKRLGDHPVELLIADEGESEQSGKAAAERLIRDGVLALTGVANSAAMLGLRETVEQARIPLIGSNASPRSLQGVVYIWRTSYITDEPGTALAAYVKKEVPRGKVGIIAADYSAGRDAVQGFQEAFGRDGRLGKPVWSTFQTSPGKRAYQRDIAELLADDPAAVYCFFAGAAAVEFIRQLRATGYDGRIYAPGFLTEGNVLDELGADAVGTRTALNYSSDLSNAANTRFAAAYRKKHGTSPTTYAVASYDAAHVLDKAIRNAGARPTSQQVNLALGTVGQVDSPRGPWQFNQGRTPQQKWYLREVRRDGPVYGNVLIDELTTLG